jgi:hypothetical protein
MLKLIKALDLQHWADTKESETLPTVVSKFGQLSCQNSANCAECMVGFFVNFEINLEIPWRFAIFFVSLHVET